MSISSLEILSEDSSGGDDSGEYIVEAILDWRHNAREKRREYYIKWQNWDESSNTWEPEGNLHCPAILKQFKEKMPEDQRFYFEHTDPASLSGFKRRAKYLRFVGIDGPHETDHEKQFYCLLLFEDIDLAEEITLEEYFHYKPEEAFEFCESRLLKKRRKTSHRKKN